MPDRSYSRDQFNHNENVQDLLVQVFNKEILKWFKDIPGLTDDDANPLFDMQSRRAKLKYACLHTDGDSIDLSILKLLVFFFVVGAIQNYSSQVYGIPIPEFHATRKFKPQITLYFAEDLDDVEPGYDPVTMEISFRLMNETSETITKQELIRLGQRIKTEFGANNGYRFHKGRICCSYTDKEKGYQFSILAFGKQDAKTLITKILDLQNHVPDWKNFNTNTNEEPTSKFPTIPRTQRILGKTYKVPRKRPVAYVRFLSATCAIWGLPKPIVLFDRTGRRQNPLVR